MLGLYVHLDCPARAATQHSKMQSLLPSHLHYRKYIHQSDTYGPDTGKFRDCSMLMHFDALLRFFYTESLLVLAM